MEAELAEQIDGSADWVRLWVERGVERCLEPDDVLWVSGQTAVEAALLTRGSLDVRRQAASGDSYVVSTLRALNVVGEMGALDGTHHSATLVAREACTLSVLSAVDFRAFIRTHPEVTEALLRQQSARLRLITRSVDAVWFDELTGLRNRRFLHRGLTDDLERALRGGHALSVAFIDIDHFKSINDTHGHASGDLALVTIARAMRQDLPVSSVLVRQGGDEFVAWMPEVSHDAAVEVLRQVAETVRARPIDVGHQKLTLTLSIGMAVFPDHARDINGLLEAADRALYVSKQQGRDRVTAYHVD